MPTETRAAPWGEDDRLEDPGVKSGAILMIGAGVMVFLFVSLALLMAFYRLELGPAKPPSTKTFPDPRLETNIDPRTVSASDRGPAAVARPHPQASQASAADLQQAMRTVAAKGAQAYAPLDPPAPAAAAGSSAPQATPQTAPLAGLASATP